MSPKCVVSTLSSLSLFNIVTQVTHALSDDEGLYYDEVSDYHQYTPPEILQDMLAEILGNMNLDAGIRFSCLHVFLRANVKKLVTGIFPHSYYNQILEIISTHGTGLYHLNLKGVWMKDNPKLLYDTLKNLTQLKVLHIPHMADDRVLECVANIKTLNVLNISGERNYTDEGLLNFCRISADNKSHLKILDIGSFGEENISHVYIANLIESLPQLASLCSYSFVGKSLLYIYTKNKTFVCKLKYIHDTLTTKEICDAVIQVCPSLESLYFDSPELGVIPKIQEFHTLTTLKLTKFQCDEIQQLFATWGNSLRSLKLSLGHGILDISQFAKCPNLTLLEFYKMEFLTHTLDLPFCKLQEFEVLYSEITSPALKYMLARSPNLRKIAIGEPIKLTDGDLYRLCADFCLLELEQVWFANARYLTVNAVELFMGHCPCLRVLGQLSGWNISLNDVDFMRAIIQSTNTDLTLLPADIGIYTF